ncbi:MAG: glycosyltransferase [Propionibacteriaceae bacterium]|nr:glycosyltransferase [Propionibacteriaceae bacterium]
MTVRDCASAELRTSVLSLLGQSHEVAELVVVDDSEGTASALFEGLTDSMKPNVKIVQLEGRQTDRLHAILSGVKQCSSDFIALQRCGDWSHPDRLKLQMSHLALHPELSGCFAASIACSSNFDWVSLTDDSPQRADLETLVFRRRSLTEDHLWWGVLGEGNVGGDTGFDELGVPVAFARHADEALRIQEADSPGFSVVLTERSLPPLDVVLAGDWSRSGGPQSSMLAELDALAARGLRTGVLHMEAARFMSTVPPELNTDIEVLIGNGETQRVHLEDSRDVRLLVLRYPPILQFAPDEPSRLAVEKMCILANQAPSELDGGDVRYLVRDCHANAQRVFTPHVIWAPQGPAVRQAIAPYLRADEISAFNLPGVIRQEKWSTRRNHRRSVVPIVGRHSRDNAMKWPDSADVLRQVYPLDGSMDVRVMGGCRAALRVLGLSTVPAAWTCWPADAMPVHSFLQSLDYYVFFPHPKAVEAFGRAILEAIASGLVVFLPPHFEAVFGPGAVYCEPGDVASFVRKFHEDSEMYAEQSRAAELMAQQEFSLAAHADRVLQMLDRARV